MAELEAVSTEETVEQNHEESVETPERKTLYETADGVMPQSLMPTWLPEKFAVELVKETEVPWVLADFRVAECNNQHSEEGFEILMVAPDGTRMFIGEDATARDSNGLFGYVIEPDDRLPLVRTAQEAIDILKPAQARKDRGLLKYDYASPCSVCGGVVFEWWDAETCRDCDDPNGSPSSEQATLVTDGGLERRDPTEDPAACSMCGCHIGYGRSDEYCDVCARDVGAKPPMRTCMGCGQTGPEEQMEAVDVSPEGEYYPNIQYLCRSCGGGEDGE